MDIMLHNVPQNVQYATLDQTTANRVVSELRCTNQLLRPFLTTDRLHDSIGTLEIAVQVTKDGLNDGNEHILVQLASPTVQ